MSPNDPASTAPSRPMLKRPKSYNLSDDLIEALATLAHAAHVSQSIFLEGLLREMPPVQAWLATQATGGPDAQ